METRADAPAGDLMSFETRWRGYAARAEQSLEKLLDASRAGTDSSSLLEQAMAYACLGGGKRIRATLVYASGELLGARDDLLDAPACALEMVHAYSLVHDDLPAMDDDELRRGRPSCHIQFDEATAILAGDALQSRAVEILADHALNPIDAGRRCAMVQSLARAIGARGMAGGQSLDMQLTRPGDDSGAPEPTAEEATGRLGEMHGMKTGALIRCAAHLGGLAAREPDDPALGPLDDYASALGMAFQVADDILDHTADTETLGKPGGADGRMGKTTYVSTLGLDGARAAARDYRDRAIESLAALGDNTGFHRQLAEFVISRTS